MIKLTLLLITVIFLSSCTCIPEYKITIGDKNIIEIKGKNVKNNLGETSPSINVFIKDEIQQDHQLIFTHKSRTVWNKTRIVFVSIGIALVITIAVAAIASFVSTGCSIGAYTVVETQNASVHEYESLAQNPNPEYQHPYSMEDQPPPYSEPCENFLYHYEQSLHINSPPIYEENPYEPRSNQDPIYTQFKY